MYLMRAMAAAAESTPVYILSLHPQALVIRIRFEKGLRTQSLQLSATDIIIPVAISESCLVISDLFFFNPSKRHFALILLL